MLFLSNTLDKHLQSTQYGFRKDKSTADAIHLIRRISEYGHQTNNQLHLVLLDWEKAFDEINRTGLMIALKRMNVDEKLIKLVQSVYKKTDFRWKQKEQAASGNHRARE